jgi:uncharacterized protein (UPF0332 family)
MAFSYDDCIKKGLLSKIPPSNDNALSSIKKAALWLADSRATMKTGAYDSCVLTSYLVMFHAARSILFNDGFREKSHACVSKYLEEVYVKPGKLEKNWIEMLDYQRNIRHNNQYDEVFLARMKTLLQSIQE